MPNVISVTPENLESVLSDLPRLVRMALGFGSKLRHGTLDVTLPDGRVCATQKKDGPCVLTFTKENGSWKLTSFDGDFSTLRIKL